tara:strand:- start:3640 stop:4065 length:426 start_codon:yes stop_codon:yes gene_type:complete
MKIIIIQSSFNKDITDSLFQGAKSILDSKNKKFSHFEVFGSWEILSLASKILEDASFPEDVAIITIGAIVKGETDHYDFLCSSIFNGLANLQVRHGALISMGILTTKNIEQAKDRAGGKKGNKGSEAALALLNLLEQNCDF